MGVDAVVEVPHRNDAPTYLFWLAMIMMLVTVFIRALSWICGYGVDFNQIADASFEELLGVLITGAVMWAESFSLESCVIGVAIVALLMQQRELSTARTVIAKLVSERNERVLEARREREITMIVIGTGLSVLLVPVSVIILLIVGMFGVRAMYVHYVVAMIVSMLENRPMD